MRKKRGESFVLFVPDFVVTFDARKDLLGFCCPLSGFFEVRPSELCFDDLINDHNIAQAHFIAQRLVQLAGLSWEWDCLSKFEQQLPESKFLHNFSDILSSVSADLAFSSLEDLLGFNVKLIDAVNGPGAYQVALQAHGTIFGLKSTLDGAINVPEQLSHATLIEDSDEELDALCISVGGMHDFNLAYIPKNADFRNVEGIQFSRAKDVKKEFLGLGYREQMTDLLFSQASNMLLQEKTVSLMSVQRSPILSWKDASDRSMIPLTFLKRKRFRQNRDVFLVLNSGVLRLA